MPTETFPMIVAALALDGLFGYPGFLLRAFGHPVMWIGALIDLADRRLNREDLARPARKVAGIFAIICVTGIAAATGFLIQKAGQAFPAGWLLTALTASTLLASRSLYEHVRDVASALETGGLESGRRAVSRIVGRDPEGLDFNGVARAAIESLAENASDGVVAPVFWFAVLGLPGLAAYKAINTADSMIGHLTPRHGAFGWASARLDDLVNLPASRLTAFLLVLGALFQAASARDAMKAILRDARSHRSPNAGWPEAAIAGALGLKLAGPRSYGGVLVPDAYIGDGRRDITASNIRQGLALAKAAWLILFTMTAALAIFSGRL